MPFEEWRQRGIQGRCADLVTKEPAQIDIGSYYGSAPLLNFGPVFTSYQDTMAVLGGLDLIITVDTFSPISRAR